MQTNSYENKDAGGAHYDNHKTKHHRKELKIDFAKAWYRETDTPMPSEETVEALIVIHGNLPGSCIEDFASTLARTWYPKK